MKLFLQKKEECSACGEITVFKLLRHENPHLYYKRALSSGIFQGF